MKTIPSQQLSEHFSLNEFEVSRQHPELVEPIPPAFLGNVKRLVETCLEPLRQYWGRPFIVNSGYRSPTLNKRLGGSETSQHLRAEAADIATGGVRDLFAAIVAGDVAIPCGQCIYYPRQNFLHVAIPGDRYKSPTFFVSLKSGAYLPIHSVADLARQNL